VSLAKNIRKLRRAADLNQLELGERLGVGQGAVSKWEAGDAEPKASMLPTLALTVNACLDELLENVNPRYDAARRGESPPRPFTPEPRSQSAAYEAFEIFAEMPSDEHGHVRDPPPRIARCRCRW
jgi:transcriptional regulator with XRE-family HTH domain